MKPKRTHDFHRQRGRRRHCGWREQCKQRKQNKTKGFSTRDNGASLSHTEHFGSQLLTDLWTAEHKGQGDFLELRCQKAWYVKNKTSQNLRLCLESCRLVLSFSQWEQIGIPGLYHLGDGGRIILSTSIKLLPEDSWVNSVPKSVWGQPASYAHNFISINKNSSYCRSALCWLPRGSPYVNYGVSLE